MLTFWGQLNLSSLIALARQVSSMGASSLSHAERGRARPAAQRSAAPGSARHEHRKRTNNVLRAGSWHWHAREPDRGGLEGPGWVRLSAGWARAPA